MGPQKGPLNWIENPNRIEINGGKNISGKNKTFTGVYVESTSYKHAKNQNF